MKACATAVGARLPLVRPPIRQPLTRSFVKLDRISSQHETRCVVSCSIRLLQNMVQRIGDNAENIFPATNDKVVKATNAISGGQVIAVPTDTIYGFACDACCSGAIDRIYEIKGRTLTRPLAICVADVSDRSRFALVDHLPHGLLDSLLPGSVTVVLKRAHSSTKHTLKILCYFHSCENNIFARSLNSGLKSIGVRVPDLDFIRSTARGTRSALSAYQRQFKWTAQ